MLGVAIDMHLVSCHSKKLGSDLRGGGRKDGTNRFETYITAQCVSSKSRLILAALYMDKSSPVHESLRRIINLCLENVSAVGSRLGLILVDRGFFSVNSISEIERLSLEYLMPCTRTSRVKDSLRGNGPSAVLVDSGLEARPLGRAPRSSWPRRSVPSQNPT